MKKVFAGLKPCPFCGYAHTDERSHVDTTIFGRVKCACCSACVYEQDEAKAVAAWNHRSLEDQLVEALKAVHSRRIVWPKEIEDKVVAALKKAGSL